MERLSSFFPHVSRGSEIGESLSFKLSHYREALNPAGPLGDKRLDSSQPAGSALLSFQRNISHRNVRVQFVFAVTAVFQGLA